MNYRAGSSYLPSSSDDDDEIFSHYIEEWEEEMTRWEEEDQILARVYASNNEIMAYLLKEERPKRKGLVPSHVVIKRGRKEGKSPLVEGILASKTIMARGRNKKDGDAVEAEESKRSISEAKNQKQLKPEPKIVKKSPNQGTERKSDKANRNKEKNKKESDNVQVRDQRDTGNKEKIDGMIFMCNAKTKADCFRYNVMGLPQSKKDIVTSIKPGIKLFMYDFDAKLLYGIYKAASAGGMKLEPAAFNGSYPAQVRFKVHMDCLPLSEGTFKKAIMGNSGGDTMKFNTELTAQEVRKLTSLFQPSVHCTEPVQIPLIPLRPIIPATKVLLQPPNAEIFGRGQKDIAPIQKETIPLDILSFGEKEYRMYGLRRPAIPAPAPAPAPALLLSVSSDPSQGNKDPYDPYASLTRAPYLSKMDSETDIPRRRVDESEYKMPAAEHSATQPAYYHSYPYGVSRSEAGYGGREAEAGRLHSTHAANALSDYNRSHQQPHDRGDYGSLPVSSRYSFAGPSF